MDATQTTAALEASGIKAGYGRSTVLRDIWLTVPEGSVVALLGANGAGKTTLLRALAGTIPIRAGSIRVRSTEVSTKAPHQRARAGICLIPEGRGVFKTLTVRENLRLAAPTWRSPGSGYYVDDAVDIFPELKTRLDVTAGRLSGGQQQMIAVVRAFLSEASVIMLDEVSMGLAPLVVDRMFEALRRLALSGRSLLLVEQYVARAIDLADRVYVMSRGSITFEGSAEDLDEPQLVRHYLGGDT
jgi:branched-chain amino acid transport system ATP-binding protein